MNFRLYLLILYSRNLPNTLSNVKREQTISDKQKREQKKRNEQEKGKTNNFLL